MTSETCKLYIKFLANAYGIKNGNCFMWICSNHMINFSAEGIDSVIHKYNDEPKCGPMYLSNFVDVFEETLSYSLFRPLKDWACYVSIRDTKLRVECVCRLNFSAGGTFGLLYSFYHTAHSCDWYFYCLKSVNSFRCFLWAKFSDELCLRKISFSFICFLIFTRDWDWVLSFLLYFLSFYE